MAGETSARTCPKQHRYPKLKRGAVDLQVFACYVARRLMTRKGRGGQKAFDQIEAVHRLAAENPADLEIVRTYADAARLRNRGKTAASSASKAATRSRTISPAAGFYPARASGS